MNDLIADTLTRLRNASQANHTFTRVKNTKLILQLIKILCAEKYISSYIILNKNEIQINLIFTGFWVKKPAITTIKKISNVGKRIFSSYQNFSKYVTNLKYAHGIAIVSTSSNLMTHKQAKLLKLGGEILCYIN